MNENIFTTEFMNKLEKLSLNVHTIMTTGSAGGRKSKAKGMSVEFSDYREYVPSDDFRRIDWNAYGRFKKLYIKLFMEEKEAVFRLFIDDSKSMAFSNKNVMALQLAATFSYLALSNLDKVLLNPLNSGESNIFLGQGKNAFMKYLKYLENINFDGTSTHFDQIKRINFNGSGLSILMSDLFTDDSIEDIIKFLSYNKQQILILHILAPEEIEPQLDGRLKLKDSETGEEKNLVMTPELLRRYQRAYKKFTEHVQSICTKYGAHYVGVKSTDGIEKIILEDLMGNFIGM